MVAGSILPVALFNNQLYFLFGKENSMEDSAKGFSDFGGGTENGETPYDTAMREGGEELTGFLGGEKELRSLISKNGGIHHIEHNDYHVHIFATEYDENLPKYYNLNHRFLWDHMDHKVLNKSKLFEKIEIQWFTPEQMKSKIKEFREFYQEIVQKFLDHLPEIRTFIEKKQRRLFPQNSYKNKQSKKTRKNLGK